MTGILGKKLGMTQIYEEDGTAVPVTVIEAQPGCVVQVKNLERDGYEALKVGFFEARKEKNFTKPELGVFKKAGTKTYKVLREFPMEEASVGDAVSIEGFKKGDVVSVSGTSKGKGFQGVVKRHGFSGGPASHGSMFGRAPGSIGASAYPSRVWKNQKMPGRMGSERVTTSNLKVADVRTEQNLLLIKGAVPGARNSIVEVRKVNKDA
ncbi:MAG: 50S ribosomal protein L3 [Planctomycetota bacterium]